MAAPGRRRRRGGFDLDPAAGIESEQIATDQYTPEDDGLAQPWYGDVWLNPPFDAKKKWFRRLISQYEDGDVTSATALAPVDTSTKWFQRWFTNADALGWLEGRDWYEATGSPSFNTVVGVWNPTDDVLETLDRLGTVTRPVDVRGQQTTLSDLG
jgi:hypothetical protein